MVEGISIPSSISPPFGVSPLPNPVNQIYIYLYLSTHRAKSFAALQTILPDSVPVHHLGLFRDPISLQPVEYYNNLPNHHHHHHHQQQQSNPPTSITPVTATAAATADEQEKEDHLAILIDPIIATGGTCAAAIQTLREWGVTRILVIAILGSVSGLCRAADEWPQEDHHPSPPNTTTTTTTINDPPPQPPSKSSRRAGKGKGSGVEIWVAGVDDHFDDKGMIIPGLGDVGDRLFMTVGK